MTQTLLRSLEIVTSAPFFWSAMGAMTATSIFIGAALYNTNMSKLKSLISAVIIYVFFIAFINLSRIYGKVISGEATVSQPNIYNATITIILAAFFYLLGIVIGTAISQKFEKKIDDIVVFNTKNNELPIINKKVSPGDKIKILIDYRFQKHIYPVRLFYYLVSKDDEKFLNWHDVKSTNTLSISKQMKFIDQYYTVPKVKPGEYRLHIEAIYTLRNGKTLSKKIKTQVFEVI